MPAEVLKLGKELFEKRISKNLDIGAQFTSFLTLFLYFWNGCRKISQMMGDANGIGKEVQAENYFPVSLCSTGHSLLPI